jgi:hypothetical protein
MTSKTKSPALPLAPRNTLADVLAAVDRSTALSPIRRRDLRSSVVRVTKLLGNVPARIALDLPTIATSLAAVNPVAAGVTSKRFANIRSDFLAAVRASGLISIGAWHKVPLAPALRPPQTETGAPGPLALRALCERPRNRPAGRQRRDGRGFHHRRSRAIAARHPELAVSAGHTLSGTRRRVIPVWDSSR